VLNRTFDCSQAQTGFACVQGKSPGLSTAADGEEMLVAGACNHPNWLLLAFRLELIRLAALATREVAPLTVAIHMYWSDSLPSSEFTVTEKRKSSPAAPCTP
jgi:hypothetical protein